MEEIDNISLGVKTQVLLAAHKVPHCLPPSPPCLHLLHLHPLLTPFHPCQPPHCSLQTSGIVQPQGLCTGCSLCLGCCSSCSSQDWILLILQISERPSLTILPKFIFISVPDYLLQFGTDYYLGQFACFLSVSPLYLCLFAHLPM